MPVEEEQFNGLVKRVDDLEMKERVREDYKFQLKYPLDDVSKKVIKDIALDSEYNNGNSGTTMTIDWRGGAKQKLTLTGNCTISFNAPSGACDLTLRLVQDGTGSRTVTWPSSVQWSNGATPTLTTTAGSTDIITFYFDGTNYYGFATLNVVASGGVFNYSQNFNTLTVGQLHGQDGWIGNTGFAVSTTATAVFEGANGVTATNLDDTIVRTTNNFSTGTFYIAMKMNSGGTRIALTLREGSTTAVTTIDVSGGNWRYNDGAWHILQAFAGGTWYVLKIVFDCSADRYSLQFYTVAGGWGTTYTNLAFANNVSSVNRLELYVDSASIIYFDTISLTDPT